MNGIFLSFLGMCASVQYITVQPLALVLLVLLIGFESDSSSCDKTLVENSAECRISHNFMALKNRVNSAHGE